MRRPAMAQPVALVDELAVLWFWRWDPVSARIAGVAFDAALVDWNLRALWGARSGDVEGCGHEVKVEGA